METNEKYISIPPYLSTSWRNVRSLHMKEGLLIVTLIDGSTVDVPNLKPTSVEKVFMCHANFLHYQGNRPGTDAMRGKEVPHTPRTIEGTEPSNFPPQFRLNLGSMENFGAALQHNQAQANSPDLPLDMLQKIAAVAKIVAPDDVAVIPKPEPHCNCMHCQISRAIHHGLSHETKEEPKAVPHDDIFSEDPNEGLTFKEWNIVAIGENMFQVTNPLDHLEKYNVYLGQPVGCTCGNPHCEHILAVLRS